MATYAELPPVAQLLFRRIGFFPGPTVNAELAAELAGVSLTEAVHGLAILRQRDLLGMPAVDRYRMHDFLRLYAAERCGAEDSDAERTAASLRIAHWLLARLRTAVSVISEDPTARGGVDHAACFASPQEALRWVEAERMTLIAMVAWTAALGLHQNSWEIVGYLGMLPSGSSR